MTKNDFGVWECVVKSKGGQLAIPHNSKVKVRWRSTPFHLSPSNRLLTLPHLHMTDLDDDSSRRTYRAPACLGDVRPALALVLFTS